MDSDNKVDRWPAHVSGSSSALQLARENAGQRRPVRTGRVRPARERRSTYGSVAYRARVCVRFFFWLGATRGMIWAGGQAEVMWASGGQPE